MASTYPFETRFSTGKGQGNFATRAIAAGEVVLMEKVGWKIIGNIDPESVIQSVDLLDDDTKTELSKLHSWGDAASLRWVRGALKIPRPDGSLLDPEQRNYYTYLYFVMGANSFGIHDSNGNPGRGVFIRTSRFNHSCDPNVSYSVDSRPGWWIGRAKRDIAVNEEITVNYVPITNSGPSRRADLRGSWDSSAIVHCVIYPIGRLPTCQLAMP